MKDQIIQNFIKFLKIINNFLKIINNFNYFDEVEIKKVRKNKLNMFFVFRLQIKNSIENKNIL